MRNLKKVLSLTLALVMLLGMMVVGAGAAEYRDAADIEYKEAVEVMSAIGVIDGKGNNEFDPKGNLTRAEAAKLITYMVLGKSVADKLPNTGSKFVDCPDGQWYVGSVNYLSDTGIISGVGNGLFDPESNVTGVEFAKMLLGILGYDAKNEKFVDDPAWAANIAVKARSAGLDADMTTQTVISVALNRDQAAMMGFNTLKADMKYYEGGMDVTTPDGTTIKVGGELKTVTNKAEDDYQSDGSTTMQFCEQYFPGLKLTDDDATDSFGRSANVWSYNNKDITIASTAEPTVVYTKGGITAAQIKKATGAADADVDGTKIWTDGVVGSAGDVDVTSKCGNGVIVEIYASNKTIDKVVVINKTVATLSGDPVTRTKDDVEQVTIPGTIIRNLPTSRVSGWENLAKGDVVLIASGKDGADTVYEIEKAESLTGVVSGTKGSDLRIDGKYYTVSDLDGAATGWTAKDFKNEYTFYLDNGGFIVAGGTEAETKAPTKYAVVLDNEWFGNTSLSQGGTGHGEAKLLLSDGTTQIVTVTKVNGTAATVNASPDPDEITGLTDGNIVTYVDKGDNKFELTTTDVTNTSLAANIAITKGAANVVYNTSSKQAVNSKTIFFVSTGTGDDIKYSAYVGNGEVPSITSGQAAKVVVKSGVAVAIYVTQSSPVDADSSDYVYIPTTSPDSEIEYLGVANEKGDDYAYYEIDAVVNGVEETLKVAATTDQVDPNGSPADLDRGTLYKVDKVDPDTGAATAFSVVSTNTGVSLSDGTVVVNSKAYTLNEDTQIIRVREDQTIQTIAWNGSFSDTTDAAAVIETKAGSEVAKAVYIIEDVQHGKTLQVEATIDGTEHATKIATNGWTTSGGKDGSTKAKAQEATLTISGSVTPDKSLAMKLTVPAGAKAALKDGTVPTTTAATGQERVATLYYTVTAEDGEVCWYKLTLDITSD